MCSGIRSVGQLGSTVSVAGPPRFGPWAIGFQRTEAGHFLQLRRPASEQLDELNSTLGSARRRVP